MEIKQNPFSLYDFLGYLIPGITLNYGVIFTYSDNNLETFYKLITKYENISLTVPFIIISYIFGHFLSFISSLTIEKYALWRYGYPSKFLLEENEKENSPKYFNEKIISVNTLLKILLPTILLPILILDFISRNILNRNYWNNRTLDSLSREIIKAKGINIYKSITDGLDVNYDKINFAGVDWFTILHHYTFERTKTHNTKFQNYVALYGFLRCISFLFIVFFWMNVYSFWQNNYGLINLNKAKTALLILLPYISFLSFLKFYKRYSLETLMAMTVLNSDEDNS
ncbi:hypothetical protein EOJ36_09495 [Sandaracinomonas limnophila]|uniref:Uncharacterized protein n=1 Tax=Sandaracinomonas limnophila TaxID=1862386 RepID=A0A437PPG0_9BACT|nr:hypothetical protein [Sandaracinomonas limnophila]RVU24150.1 hypothetical protein EOJ36_09495 [Sandaracinomonas limnophila]